MTKAGTAVTADDRGVRDFDEFVRARLSELVRFGRALTGDEHRGADLVQDALERALPRWGQISARDPEGYVRRIMVNRNISIWRSLRRERLTDRLGPRTAAGVQRYKDVIVDTGTVGSDRANPLGHISQLHVTPWQAVLATPGGTVPVHLRLNSFQGGTRTAMWGSHVVLLSGDDRIYASDDGGRHWHED